MPVRDFERLGELARARAEAPDIFHSTARFHQRKSAPRLESTDQDEAAAFSAFDQQVKHPVNAIVEIDIDRSGLIALDEGSGARPGKRVASFVIQRQIRLRLDDNAGTFSPDQFRPDKLTGAQQWIALEERAREKGSSGHAVTVRNKRAA
jgi:hypothetical protein